MMTMSLTSRTVSCLTLLITIVQPILTSLVTTTDSVTNAPISGSSFYQNNAADIASANPNQLNRVISGQFQAQLAGISPSDFHWPGDHQWPDSLANSTVCTDSSQYPTSNNFNSILDPLTGLAVTATITPTQTAYTTYPNNLFTSQSFQSNLFSPITSVQASPSALSPLAQWPQQAYTTHNSSSSSTSSLSQPSYLLNNAMSMTCGSSSLCLCNPESLRVIIALQSRTTNSNSNASSTSAGNNPTMPFATTALDTALALTKQVRNTMKTSLNCKNFRGALDYSAGGRSSLPSSPVLWCMLLIRTQSDAYYVVRQSGSQVLANYAFSLESVPFYREDQKRLLFDRIMKNEIEESMASVRDLQSYVKMRCPQDSMTMLMLGTVKLENTL
jgi:hypothetical protein